MRNRLTTLGRIGRAAAAAALTVGVGLVPATPAHAALKDKDLASSMHGALETQAVTVGNGALSLLVDPGTAYAYSTFDRDDYGEDSVSYTMTARGANLNLGTIAYAVLWAPPTCSPSQNVPCVLSGGYDSHGLNTGLHEAKGFPGYAEALYPPPPPEDGASQERVYKCVVNKDGPGSPPGNGEAQTICKTNDGNGVPMTAWAETLADEYTSRGFSRAAGFDLGVLAVNGSESRSVVQAIGEGKLQTTGYSNVNGISLLGGWIRIDNVHSEASIVSTDAGVDSRNSSSSCTFAGLTVANQRFADDGSDFADPRMQAALDQIAAATQYKVELIKPTADPVAQVDDGKFYTACSGFQVKFTDLHTQAPVPVCFPSTPDPAIPKCVPALGNREEFAFGRISAQQSVNENPTFDDLTGGLDELDTTGGGDFGSGAAVGGGDLGGSDLGGGGAALDSSSGIGTDLSGGGLGTDSIGSSSSSGAGSSGRSRKSVATGSSGSSYDVGGGEEPYDLKTIGTLTAVSGGGLFFAVLALMGVVNALAGGRPFKMPGFGG